MPDHPRTPLPIQLPRTLGESVIAKWKDHPGAIVPGPVGCCRDDRSRATDERLTRMGDPANHADDHPYDTERWVTEPDPRVLPVTLDPGATLPTRAHPADAGLDLTPLDGLPEPVRLLPGQVRIIPTGVHVAIMPGYVGKVEGRSGLATKGIIPLGAIPLQGLAWEGTFPLGGIIDEGFVGSIGIIMANVGLNHWEAIPGKPVAQLVEYKIARRTPMVVGGLGATVRGEDGFGSSDRKDGNP